MNRILYLKSNVLEYYEKKNANAKNSYLYNDNNDYNDD